MPTMKMETALSAASPADFLEPVVTAAEMTWQEDGAFHEFGPATDEAEGADGERYRLLVVGGRSVDDEMEEGEDPLNEPQVIMHACALSGADDSMMKLTADGARTLAGALISAADEADRAIATDGHDPESILQAIRRVWSRSR